MGPSAAASARTTTDAADLDLLFASDLARTVARGARRAVGARAVAARDARRRGDALAEKAAAAAAAEDMTRCASRGAVGCDEERRGAHHSQAVDDVDEGGNSETQGRYGIFRFQRWYSAR